MELVDSVATEVEFDEDGEAPEGVHVHGPHVVVLQVELL